MVVPQRRPISIASARITIRTTLGLALALLVISFVVRDSNWISGLLIEVAVTMGLFAPLVWMEQQLERRIDEAEHRQSDLLRDVRRGVREALDRRDELNERREQWAAARKEGKARATVLPASYTTTRDGSCGALTRDGNSCQDRVVSHGLCNNHLQLVASGRIVLWRSTGLGVELGRE